uniref:H(+)/Cl(-) exchange transporter 7 n=1 Tax=Cacopsylla melanoneura TaxID=428564 RepID=A0A8D9BCF0_9HEMI
MPPLPVSYYGALFKNMFTVECSIEFLEEMRTHMSLQVLEKDNQKQFDLTPFVNQHVYFIRSKTSMNHIYRVLRQMGIRTLYVVDDERHLLGIITRKDVVRYKL